jgi:hypothetical protein
VVAHERSREGVEVSSFLTVDSADGWIVASLRVVASLYLEDYNRFSFDRDDVCLESRRLPVCLNDRNAGSP